MENSPSGLWRTLGKRVGVTASRVRISYSPPSGFPDFRKPFFHIGNGILSALPATSDAATSMAASMITAQSTELVLSAYGQAYFRHACQLAHRTTCQISPH